MVSLIVFNSGPHVIPIVGPNTSIGMLRLWALVRIVVVLFVVEVLSRSHRMVGRGGVTWLVRCGNPFRVVLHVSEIGDILLRGVIGSAGWWIRAVVVGESALKSSVGVGGNRLPFCSKVSE